MPAKTSLVAGATASARPRNSSAPRSVSWAGPRVVLGRAGGQPACLEAGEQSGDRGRAERQLPLAGEEVVQARRGAERAAYCEDPQDDVLAAGDAGSVESVLEHALNGSFGFRDVLSGEDGGLSHEVSPVRVGVPK